MTSTLKAIFWRLLVTPVAINTLFLSQGFRTLVTRAQIRKALTALSEGPRGTAIEG